MPRFLPIVAGVALLAGCSRGDDAAAPPPAELDEQFPAGHFLQFLNPQPSLAPGYARAYYAAVDARRQRRSFDDWKRTNGFDDGEVVHVIFRDTHDLGYGRSMYLHRGDDGRVAAYVDNFLVADVPGQAYTRLNVEAAISGDAHYHVGTNAIEWSPVDADGDGNDDDRNGDGAIDARDFIVKFYSFDPRPPQALREEVNIDGRGAKPMPVPCILCHGGRADPLLPDGSFPRGGDTRSKLQALDVDSFEFAADARWRREAMEPGLRALNLAVYDSYAVNAPPRPGEWNAAAARALIESWYGGAGLPNAVADTRAVPAGWTPGPGRDAPPEGADELYRRVVAPGCRTCHLLRGVSYQSDIDFATYAKFIGYAPQVEHMVFERNRMPLAAIAFDDLWRRPDDVALLASFLPDFDEVDAQGRILPPGHPVADAGPDRFGPSPLRMNGVASTAASHFSWRVVGSPEGASAALDDPGAMRPLLSASAGGVYTLELTVSDGRTSSAPDTVQVTIDPRKPDPATLTFEHDIKPIVSRGFCASCHAPEGSGARPPVYFTEPDPGENRDVYATVRSLIWFDDPGNSPLLRKPSGSHHYAPGLTGFVPRSHDQYDLILNWIAEGARRE